MQGKNLDPKDEDFKQRGLQPRVFDFIFNYTHQMKKTQETDYLIKCSYLEIYNEQIRDLVI